MKIKNARCRLNFKGKKALCFIALKHHGRYLFPVTRALEAEGGLPVDNLPRTPAGRIVRAAGDQEFEKYRAETEDAPGDWRSWFRLSCAYDAAGDRKRARSSMRDAERLYRFPDTGATI